MYTFYISTHQLIANDYLYFLWRAFLTLCKQSLLRAAGIYFLLVFMKQIDKW